MLWAVEPLLFHRWLFSRHAAWTFSKCLHHTYWRNVYGKNTHSFDPEATVAWDKSEFRSWLLGVVHEYPHLEHSSPTRSTDDSNPAVSKHLCVSVIVSLDPQLLHEYSTSHVIANASVEILHTLSVDTQWLPHISHQQAHHSHTLPAPGAVSVMANQT